MIHLKWWNKVYDYFSHFYEGEDLDIFYSAAYMSQTCDQQRFTISEVADDGRSQWCNSALCGYPLPALTDN